MVLCHSCGQSIRCPFCDEFVPKEDPNEFEHAACNEEWKCRYAAGKCTYCGKNDEHEPKSGKCAGCAAMDDPPYIGYPGGK